MALERDRTLAGRIVVAIAIAGEADVEEDSDLLEAGLVECISGTVYGLEFEPPHGGGRMVVRYPPHRRLITAPVPARPYSSPRDR